METKAWGKVPINQMGIVLKDGLKKSDAEAVAKTLDGSVVGEVSYINLYQLELSTSTEADLDAAIKKAKGTNGVELAFPNQAVELWTDIKGERCSALNDPVYSGEKGSSYKMIGVQNAWDILKASGAELSEVHVGVTDNALYKGNDEFDGNVKVNTEGSDGEVSQPENGSDGKAMPQGTHGTAVTGIIAANPDNGGMAGIASPLGSKMQITHTNVFGQKYGGNTAVAPDPDDADDPTTYVSGGQTFSIGPLVPLKEQIEKGATVINCS
ncbi:MAG: S8 family serine peptidase [Chloroflexota bacterium]